jgi:glycosyltransferase involved in cell wall biosynthesis
MKNKYTDIFLLNNNFSKCDHVKTITIYENNSNGDILPEVTIAIPTFKRHDLLKIALESALNQKGVDNFEVIVIDNDPTRNCETELLMMDYIGNKVSYFKNEENIGMVGNWNRCISLARSKYITILNDDDWLEHGYLQFSLSSIRNTGEALYFKSIIRDLRSGYNYQVSNTKLFFKKFVCLFSINQHKISIYDFFMAHMASGTLGILYVKDNMLKLGGFDDRFFPAHDYVFNLNYKLNFGSVYIKKHLMNYRIASNESLNIASEFAEVNYAIRMQIAKKYYYNSQIIKYYIKLLYEINYLDGIRYWNLNISKLNENNFFKKLLRFIIKQYVIIRNLILYV